MRAFSFKDYHYEWLVVMTDWGWSGGRIWNFVIDAQRFRNEIASAINHDRGWRRHTLSIRAQSIIASHLHCIYIVLKLRNAYDPINWKSD